jgi:diguanylate cyclase (GGDEF)-like protein/PAS domain S-box-containing protein
MDNAEQQSGVKVKEESQKLGQLHLAVNFLDQLFNGIQDIILVIDPRDYKIVTFNQSALDGLGLNEADLLGTNCHKLFYGQSAPCQIPFHTCPVKQVLKTKEHMLAEYEYTASNKQLKYFEASVNLIGNQRDNQQQIVYVLRDITARKKKRPGGTTAGYKDRLTNLYNQVFFNHQLEMELSRAKRYARPLSLMVLGIDNLAAFDTLSLVEKSDLLRTIGEVINDSIRATDSGYHYETNKFQLILPETDEASALVAAGRLRQAFKSRILKIPIRQVSIFSQLTISIGIAGFLPADNAETFMAKALSALQNAQTSGGDKICIYHPQDNP